MFTLTAKESILRAARKSDEMLEPYEWKRSRTVLRRERASNRPDLADDGLEIHTVREWFHDFNIPLKDDYFFTWTKTQATLCKHLRFLEEHLSEKTMLRIWNAILISLYLHYEITEDFQTQFKKNSDAILSLIETLKNFDIPMPKKA
ncbi:hypothetical protein IMSAGC013_03694 [Lachnospiraceae bacterium]|nr:hypothetical protein IMSAGC013_03694 [Lachnospiraceae bacterium]